MSHRAEGDNDEFMQALSIFSTLHREKIGGCELHDAYIQYFSHDIFFSNEG